MLDQFPYNYHLKDFQIKGTSGGLRCTLFQIPVNTTSQLGLFPHVKTSQQIFDRILNYESFDLSGEGIVAVSCGYTLPKF